MSSMLLISNQVFALPSPYQLCVYQFSNTAGSTKHDKTLREAVKRGLNMLLDMLSF